MQSSNSNNRDSQPIANDQAKFQTSRALIHIGCLMLLAVVLFSIFNLFQNQAQPVDLGAGLERGNRQLDQGQFGQAEQTFLQLTKNYPSAPQPFKILASLYARRGADDQAKSYLRKALQVDPSFATIHQNLRRVSSLLKKAPVRQAQPKVQAVAESPAAQASRAEAVAEVILEAEPTNAAVFLNSWAEAWASQDVDAYLAHYASDFSLPNNLTRQQWERQRRSRISKPSMIEVELSDFLLREPSKDRLQVDLTQSYKSDRFNDITRKRFDLAKTGSSWLIVAEQSLGKP